MTVRSRFDESDRSSIAGRYADMRIQYTAQLQRAKFLFSNPRMKHPCCAALLRVAVGSAKVSRLIYDAFRAAEPAHRGGQLEAVDPEIVQEAIIWNNRQLDQLEFQLHWLDSAEALMPSLRQLAGQLETVRRTSALGWQNLARHFLADATAGADAAPVLPLPGLSLGAYLAHIGHGFYGEAFGRGIETARILARFLRKCDADPLEIDLLIIAALCQDCGIPLLTRHWNSARGTDSARARLRELHPSMGAALVAAMVEFSTDLPTLVAEHHQRLGGWDRPSDLCANVQKAGSRLLSATVRFLEILAEFEPTSSSGEVSNSFSAHDSAAVQLLREADRGEWDLQLTAGILAAAGFQVEYESVNQTSEVQHGKEAAVGIRRFDWGRGALPAPNFPISGPVHGLLHVHPTRH